VFFTVDPGNLVVERHIRGGGRAVVVRRDSDTDGFFLVNGAGTNLFLGYAPATSEKSDLSNTTSAVGAVAACTALGIDREHINVGLRSWVTLHPERQHVSAFAALRRCP
jgi:hypothetical protein